jgi:hypothetical protein
MLTNFYGGKILIKSESYANLPSEEFDGMAEPDLNILDVSNLSQSIITLSGYGKYFYTF